MTDWDYSINENICFDKMNLTNALIRSIGRILGFGSSIKVTGDNYSFGCRRGYSVFDYLVECSDGSHLTDIPLLAGRTNPQLKEYCNDKTKSYFVIDNKPEHSFHIGDYSASHPPFCYTEQGIMKDKITNGDCIFQIDNPTIEVMNRLGWNMTKKYNVNIICTDISDQSGILTSYEPHSFTIDSCSEELWNQVWTLKLPLKNGDVDEQIIGVGSNFCLLSPLKDPSNYHINADGCIKCSLEFSADSKADNFEVSPYTISWELEPAITSVEYYNVRESRPGYYDVDFKVYYRGSDKLKVGIEEEFTSVSDTWYINEPCIATGTANNIFGYGYAWLNFEVSNKDLRASKSIMLPPLFDSVNDSSLFNNDTSNTNIVMDTIPVKFEVVDINGIKIWEGNTLSEFLNSSFKGIAFVLKHNNNNISYTKIIK